MCDLPWGYMPLISWLLPTNVLVTDPTFSRKHCYLETSSIDWDASFGSLRFAFCVCKSKAYVATCEKVGDFVHDFWLAIKDPLSFPKFKKSNYLNFELLKYTCHNNLENV